MNLTFRFRRDANALSRLFTKVWLFLKPKREGREALRQEELSIDIITKRNGWAC